MRDIKFRGFSKKYNKFVYGDVIKTTKFKNMSFIVVSNEYDEDRVYDEYYKECEFIAIDINTIGQFTGLKDKNGVEIYEGDIVKFQYGIGRVYWCDNTSQFKIEFNIDSDSLWLYCCKNSIIEIIGNIYENKELLK